ncbi:MAG TPA: FeoA family protein [bacterium]|jgi:ferrous iron transport protein A|nr:FeoA family protein [bacterium]
MLKKETLLNEIECGVVAEVVGFVGGSALQSRLRALGLCEGKKIQKLCNVKLGGPVVIEVDRAQVAIGKKMAEKIIVKVMSENNCR